MAETPIEDAVLVGRRVSARALVVAGWVAVVAATIVTAVREPTVGSYVLPALVAVLFALTEASRRVSAKARHRVLRDLMLRLDNTTYTSDREDLPNRNYMLDQLRREMPRARATGEPFVVVVVTIDNLEALADRRGADFAERAVRSLSRSIERSTRTSDFAAELEPGSFGVLLYDCDLARAQGFLRRLPGTIAISNGKQMLEVALIVRTSEYDMESVYAIDVLREAEEAPLAREAERMRWGAEAA